MGHFPTHDCGQRAGGVNDLLGWLVAYLFRWFPHATVTGLRPVGDPDETSPVLVTCNFSLTVKRVIRSLDGFDLWLLVVASDGVNVWCSASGGMLSHHRVIDAIKVSELSRRVAHRKIVLPPLCAPGVDRQVIQEQTGFHCRFGPVYAKDIPEYLRKGMKKTDGMRRASFDWRHRLDMLVSMNFAIYLAIAVVLGIFRRQDLLPATALFWASAAFLYLLVDWIPGRSGWAQALYSAGTVAAIWAGTDWIRTGDPLRHWGWLAAAFAIMFSIGFDLAGIASPRRSDAEAFAAGLHIGRLGSLYAERQLGTITLDRDRCRGCRTCWDICPVAVYGTLDAENKTTLPRQSACFACGACVMQCPEQALSLRTQAAERPPSRFESSSSKR